jgi:hypothetical protein
VASHRLVHIQEHEVDPQIFSAPCPLGWSVNVADDRLTTFGYMNVLNGHLLLAAASISFERLDLSCERLASLLKAFEALLLRYGFDVCQQHDIGSKAAQQETNLRTIAQREPDRF